MKKIKTESCVNLEVSNSGKPLLVCRLSIMDTEALIYIDDISRFSTKANKGFAVDLDMYYDRKGNLTDTRLFLRKYYNDDLSENIWTYQKEINKTLLSDKDFRVLRRRAKKVFRQNRKMFRTVFIPYMRETVDYGTYC